MNQEKKDKIKQSLKETRIKRQSQKCKVFELKIDVSHLNKENLKILKMFFVEAKWIYNYILSLDNPFSYDYKNKIVNVKNKHGIIEEREINYLPSKYRQDLCALLIQNIYSLSKKKKKGQKVGKLKFKSSYSCINLSQYNFTHKIVLPNRIKITNIKSPILVYGLEQIQKYYDIADAKLIQKPSGYYIKLTTFEYIKPEQIISNLKDVGLDFGIKNNITTSEGEIFNLSIGETERLKRLQRKLNKKVKGSNNRYKLVKQIQLEYEKITNKKKDAANKVVHYLLSNYKNVYIQDENLAGWKKQYFGKQVHHSYMGRVKEKLRQSKQVIMIDKFQPTTKMCYNCGTINEISLDQRTYECSCGLKEDRDVKAAKTILHIGQCQHNFIPWEPRKFKPAENHILDSSKQEAI